jgi:hypothetical protein
MKRVVSSSDFPIWLADLPQKPIKNNGIKERDQTHAMPYRDGEFYVTPFGISLQNGKKLYTPEIPKKNSEIS